jgi:D-lactate dehydratase / protein deglycase
MPNGLCEKLKNTGVNLMNTKMDKTICVDRKLITEVE